MWQKPAFSGGLHPGKNMGLWDGFQRPALDVPKTPKDKPETSIATSINTCKKCPRKQQPRKHHFDQCLRGFEGWWALLDLNQ